MPHHNDCDNAFAPSYMFFMTLVIMALRNHMNGNLVLIGSIKKSL